MFHSGLSTLVTYNPWTVTEATPLAELVRSLGVAGFHHWPVVDDEGGLRGIVSEVDILRAVEERHAVALSNAGAASALVDSACTASQLMQRRLITVGSNDSPHKALERMIASEIHSAPVVDDGRLVGMVTSTDFLREFSYGETHLSREPVTQLMEDVDDSIDVEATLDAANEEFLRSGLEYLAVVQGDFPLGVVSRRSLRMARCRESAQQWIGDSGIGGPTTIAQLIADAPTMSPGSRLAKAAALLVEHQLQAAAVVNQANRLLGVVSEDRLLKAMLDHTRQLS